MRIFRSLFTVLSLSILLSCSKEYSDEDGGTLAGKPCRVSNIVVVDDISDEGVYSMNTRFNTSDLPDYVELFDSVGMTVDHSITFQYITADTIKTNGIDIIVLDGSKRLSKLIAPVDPADPGSDKIIYTYKYNSSGYLEEKTLSSSLLPVELFKSRYTWTGGNLTRVVSTTNLLGTEQKLLEVNMEYDASKSPKNFIPIFPDAFESAMYITAVDMGKKSLHLLKKLTAIYYDDQGNPSAPAVTDINGAQFNSDGYLIEWYVNGDSFDALGLFTGKNRFIYKCN